MPDARAFLRAKREGRAHTPEELRAFIAAYAAGAVPDYQASAWLMAAFLNGLDESETSALTAALIGSGRVFDWSGLGRPSADKHSTGGVGDKVSLVLAPLVASCGVLVPMVSGRGLGHTGGTLDKLESIPGFTTRLAPGVVMVGQGPDLAPADGLLYALRDVTATVECESFIVSSIVSKKVAEGAGAVVYDVKCGNGAFMTTREAAARLARRLVATTRSLGRSAAACVTDMSQPLGAACGNALEVGEAVEVLSGGGPADVRDLVLELAASMLALAGAEGSLADARARARRSLERGDARQKFLELVGAQGGDADAIERNALPRAPVVAEARAGRNGFLAALDTRGLGELIATIGGGRRAKEDRVDPRVGLVVRRRIGDRVAAGDTLAEVHLAAVDPGAVRRAEDCFEIAEAAPAPPPLVIERFD